jgi:hypothetical protein
VCSHPHQPPHRRRLWVCVVAGLAAALGASPRARACDGTTERIVGYSWQEDQYVVEERPLDGAGPRFLTRRLTTGEVVDEVTCPSGVCTEAEALGIRACSFHPVPRKPPEGLWLAQIEDGGGDAEVRVGQGPTTQPLLRVRGTGRLALRGGVRVDGHVILFLTDAIDRGGCLLAHEQAFVVADLDAGARPPPPDGASVWERANTETELMSMPQADEEVRVAPPLPADGLELLTTAARAVAAMHLDALAGCWAQEALAILGQRPPPHAHRPAATVEVEAIRVVTVGSPTPSPP